MIFLAGMLVGALVLAGWILLQPTAILAYKHGELVKKLKNYFG